VTGHSQLPQVSVFSLGGTIASTSDPGAAGGGEQAQREPQGREQGPARARLHANASSTASSTGRPLSRW